MSILDRVCYTLALLTIVEYLLAPSFGRVLTLYNQSTLAANEVYTLFPYPHTHIYIHIYIRVASEKISSRVCVCERDRGCMCSPVYDGTPPPPLSPSPPHLSCYPAYPTTSLPIDRCGGSNWSQLVKVAANIPTAKSSVCVYVCVMIKDHRSLVFLQTCMRSGRYPVAQLAIVVEH